jgi:hypothetical protein
MKQNQIILINGRDGWLAQFVGPHASEIVGLFGTDCIPTAFTPLADPDAVRVAIQSLNPGVFVSFA